MIGTSSELLSSKAVQRLQGHSLGEVPGDSENHQRIQKRSCRPLVRRPEPDDVASHGLRLSTTGRRAHRRGRRTLSSHARATRHSPTDVPVRSVSSRTRGYERRPDAVNADVDSLQSVLFAERPRVRPRRGDRRRGRRDGDLVPELLTWEGTRGVYLEDLYVSPAARVPAVPGVRCCGPSLGSAWTTATRLELSVLDWNLPAIGFYRTLGAVGMDQWTVQRVSGRLLQALAGN